MVKDAYIENNKTKKQAWLVLPLALIIVGLIVVFGDYRDTGSPGPIVFESSSQGMLLELPITTNTPAANWQAQWVPASSTVRQQALQSLSQYAADFRQLAPQLEVRAEPGSITREKLARQLGNALAQNNLGKLNQTATFPTHLTMPDNGVVLLCAEADSVLAKRLLAALTPYLGGKVSLRFDPDITVQNMRLYFFGTPYFNHQGQATFDPIVVEQQQQQ